MLAALRSFAEQSYEGTSVREINQLLGVSHNLINRRFGSKEQLWRAVVDRWFGELVDRLIPLANVHRTRNTIEDLREFVVTFIEVNALRPELGRIINSEASLGGDRLNYLFERFISPCLSHATALATKLQSDGKMRRVPTETLFFLITHGATAPASYRPLAALLGLSNPTNPKTLRIHARTVAELLIQPPH